MDDLTRQIVRTPSASVGISGIRGIGKSTLIRWLCTERDPGRKLPTLGIYLTAPVEYDARDFLVHLYITLCKAVLADDRFTDRRKPRYRYLPRVILIVLLAIAGTGVCSSRRGTTTRSRPYGYATKVVCGPRRPAHCSPQHCWS